MINIVITILLFNVLIVLFKLFAKLKIDNLQALTINYLTVAFFCFLYSDKKMKLTEIVNEEWFYYSIILGFLFISTFYFFAYSSQKIGVAVTTISNKVSVIIPVAFALVLYPTSNISIVKFFGFFLAIIGIYFSVFSNNISIKKKYVWIILFIFFGQGILDVIFNHVVQTFLKKLSFYFLTILFINAFCFGAFFVLMRHFNNVASIKLNNLFFGIIFALPNLFSIIYFIKALNELNSAVVYSIVNVGIVVTTSLIGVLFYNEKLTKTNWLGIIISSLAICLLL